MYTIATNIFYLYTGDIKQQQIHKQKIKNLLQMINAIQD